MALTYVSNGTKYKTKNPYLIFFLGDISWSLTWGWEKHELSNIQGTEESGSLPVCRLLLREEEQEQKGTWYSMSLHTKWNSYVLCKGIKISKLHSQIEGYEINCWKIASSKVTKVRDKINMIKHRTKSTYF